MNKKTLKNDGNGKLIGSKDCGAPKNSKGAMGYKAALLSPSLDKETTSKVESRVVKKLTPLPVKDKTSACGGEIFGITSVIWLLLPMFLGSLGGFQCCSLRQRRDLWNIESQMTEVIPYWEEEPNDGGDSLGIALRTTLKSPQQTKEHWEEEPNDGAMISFKTFFPLKVLEPKGEAKLFNSVPVLIGLEGSDETKACGVFVSPSLTHSVVSKSVSVVPSGVASNSPSPQRGEGWHGTLASGSSNPIGGRGMIGVSTGVEELGSQLDCLMEVASPPTLALGFLETPRLPLELAFSPFLEFFNLPENSSVVIIGTSTKIIILKMEMFLESLEEQGFAIKRVVPIRENFTTLLLGIESKEHMIIRLGAPFAWDLPRIYQGLNDRGPRKPSHKTAKKCKGPLLLKNKELVIFNNSPTIHWSKEVKVMNVATFVTTGLKKVNPRSLVFIFNHGPSRLPNRSIFL
nr:hypothetical protein Iba_scaffold31533CG0010 [Ipomoea batatas]GMD78037.1 hypothetical protein Iba_chr13cCG9100 [Ipomoea batatas]